ncbi:MAG TPA: hypothetical protein VLI06_16315 [Solimonas sp.]|nr:hypothetical protein [Solimonas sp.]
MVLLAPWSGASAACDSAGFTWLGCSSPATIPSVASGWSGTPSHSSGLETTLSLAEWRSDELSRQALRLHFDARSETEDMLRRWRYGAGLDLALPGDGMLQASLSTSRRRRGEGARYALTPEGIAAGRSQPLWALGLSLAPEEDSDGDRRFLLAPQLRVDLDRLIETPGRAELYVEYTPWVHNLAGDVHEGETRRQIDQRVPQLRLRWRF